MELLVKRVKEVYYRFSKLILKIELFTLLDLLSTLDEVVSPLVDILEEILSSCFEKQDLVVVVAMV